MKAGYLQADSSYCLPTARRNLIDGLLEGNETFDLASLIPYGIQAGRRLEDIERKQDFLVT